IMADVNAPIEQAPAVAPPTRIDEQILPRIRWVPIGKSNCYLDAEKSQSNPIYKIAVDILKHTRLRTDGGYKCQLDDQWFNLTKDTLKDALQIAPVNNNKDFSSPLTLSMVWAIQKKSNTYLMSLLMTCFNYSLGHHQSSSYQLCGKDVGIIHSIHPYLHGRQKESGTTYSVKEESHSHCDPKSKGTKREVFGMPIPNELITDDIRGADYYGAYLQKVAKHQRYLAGEEVTAKPKGKKHKLVTKTSEAPSPAKRSKAGKVAKKRTKKSSPRLVDEFVNEGVPENEPRIGDEEADLQKAVEESLKEFYSARQGPLPPVVIREPESGKFQPLPKVHLYTN
ncbi:monodehydroascorbate reductase, partial [Tanacetum coccineum]